MREILEGSDKVGKENWAQDKNGKMGVIIGAQEWEEKTAYLDMVGDWFNYTNLFLNLCLVFGAICLVIQNEKNSKNFFYCNGSFRYYRNNSLYLLFLFRMVNTL